MNIEQTIEEHARHFLQNLKKEIDGDKDAAAIIGKYIKHGQITDEEDHVLRTQFMDSLKIIGVGVPFILIPGASILIPIIVKVAEKHNIELIPSAFNNNDNNHPPQLQT